MDDLEIKDRDGDWLSLRDGEPYPVVCAAPENGAYITTADAEKIIDWLSERFELSQPALELERVADTQYVSLVIPQREGDPREISWSGPDPVPEWMQALARAAASTTSSDMPSGAAYAVLRKLMTIFGESSIATLPTSAETAVKRLREQEAGAEKIRERLGELTNVADAKVMSIPSLVELFAAQRDQTPLAKVVRQLTAALGAERPEDLPVRVEMLREECDSTTRALLRWAGQEPGPNGVDIPKLIEGIKARHREALANTQAQGDSRLRSATESFMRRVDVAERKLTSSISQEEHEARLARERETRAGVQERLDAAIVDLLQARQDHALSQSMLSEVISEREELERSLQLESERHRGCDEHHREVRAERDKLAEQLKESRKHAMSARGGLEVAVDMARGGGFTLIQQAVEATFSELDQV